MFCESKDDHKLGSPFLRRNMQVPGGVSKFARKQSYLCPLFSHSLPHQHFNHTDAGQDESQAQSPGEKGIVPKDLNKAERHIEKGEGMVCAGHRGELAIREDVCFRIMYIKRVAHFQV